MERGRANTAATLCFEARDEQIADPSNRAWRANELRTQDPGDCGPGIQKVDINAARPIMSGSHNLGNTALLSCPTDAPGIHLQNTFKPVFADHSGERWIAKATPRSQCIDQMVLPVIGTFTTDGSRNRHLRHDGRPTPPDQTPVDQQHIHTQACGF